MFGQVTLAMTVGLSMKDLRLNAQDNDKSKYMFVAVKKLKPETHLPACRRPSRKS